MDPEEIIFYKIEDYLKGRLTPQERVAFEADIAADATLAALVKRQEREKQALELLTERELRTQMNAWERQAPATLTPVRSRRYYWWVWAAAAMVILVGSWWLLQRMSPVEAPMATQPGPPVATPKTKPPGGTAGRPKQTPKPEDATDDHAGRGSKTPAVPKPAPPAPVKKPVDYAALSEEYYRESNFFPRSSSGTGAAGYDRALKDFQDGRFNDLESQLRPDRKTGSNDLKNRELLAHSMFKNRRYNDAIAAFQSIANMHRQPYADRAEWALALTYLQQMPRRAGALDSLLQQMAEKPGHAYSARAKALRARLQQQ